MGIFGFFRRKGNLLSTTQNLISELRNILAKEQLITKAESGKVQKMFEHVMAVEDKIMQHDKLLNSMKPRDQRRLAVLQAELGDVEELRRAIQLFYEELDHSTELQNELKRQMVERTSAKMSAVERALSDTQPTEPEEVQKILGAMRKKKE